MLESIHLRSVATYSDTGVRIDDLKPINFIYGANGSGKTTISNFLADGNSQNIFRACDKEWLGGGELDIIVYNKQFKEDNFKRENIDGVFTLGEATKEKKEAIARLVEKRDQIKADGVKKKTSLDKLTEEKAAVIENYKERFWKDIYKRNESNFKEAFKGFLKKDSFMQRVLDEGEATDEEIASVAELKKESKTIFGDAPKALFKISEIDFSEIHDIERNPIWTKKIIGKNDIPISKLIQVLGNNDWVNAGREFLKEDDDVCPFCQEKTITDNLRRELDQFFDKSFVDDTATVKELKNRYKQESLNAIHSLERVADKERELKTSKLDIDRFSALVKTLDSQSKSNTLTAEVKEKEPSREYSLEDLSSQTEEILELIRSNNAEVTKHNKIVENYDYERAKLIASIWKTLVHFERATISEFTKKRDGLQQGIDRLAAQRRQRPLNC
jgi:wobble nucleotide-excising tRNase